VKEEKLYSIIKSQVVTEKSLGLTSKHNQLVFRVAMFATKLDIKKAVEELFKVSVLSVRVLTVPGKTKRHKGTIGKRASWKKAMVKLEAEQSINVLDFA
jgi:large subunit ribosomal protein L23